MLKPILPNKCKHFAADLKLSGLLVCYDTLVGGKDCNSESVKYLRNLIFASVNAKTGLGDSLKACDDLVILVSAVFKSNSDILEVAIVYKINALYITLIEQNLRDGEFDLGVGNIILVSISAIGSLIVI